MGTNTTRITMDDEPNNIVGIVVILIFIGLTLGLLMDTVDNPSNYRHVKNPVDRPINNIQIRKGYNFKSKDLSGDYRYYTDDDIRLMRNQNSNLIIRVPGRIIPSSEELFEDKMEEYLLDNPELLEDFIDGNRDY
jgi:hypothetical protein